MRSKVSTKTINQEATGCDAEDCDKFFIGEQPKSWKHVKVWDGDPLAQTSHALDFDACSVKHAKAIISEYATIS